MWKTNKRVSVWVFHVVVLLSKYKTEDNLFYTFKHPTTHLVFHVVVLLSKYKTEDNFFYTFKHPTTHLKLCLSTTYFSLLDM